MGKLRPRPTVDDLRRLAAEGLTLEAIGDQYGMTKSRIWQLCNEHGIRTKPVRHGSPAHARAAAVAVRQRSLEANLSATRRCAAAGMTSRQTAAETGLSLHTIYRYSSRHGVEFLVKEKSGPKHSPKRRRPPTTAAPLDCRICERATVQQLAALLQLGEHPGMGHVWPRCRQCAVRIAGHVAGIEAVLSARHGARSEGW